MSDDLTERLRHAREHLENEGFETQAIDDVVAALAAERQAREQAEGERFVPIDRADFDAVSPCGHYMRFRLPWLHEDGSETMSCMQCDRDRAQDRAEQAEQDRDRLRRELLNQAELANRLEAQRDDARAASGQAEQERDRLASAIRWALGEAGEFDPPDLGPRYWWRTELRKRAALSPQDGQPATDRRKPCSCLGTCRGADGLAPGYRCALSPQDGPR